MADRGIGWELDNRKHFDEVVNIYDSIRPSYPDEMLKDIFNRCSGKYALEIGAGTGKATKPFLDAGYNVTAIEIGENMAEFLSEKFKDNPNFSVIVSSFEDVELEKDTYDLIYAATAFHWVDAEVGCPKVYDLLKSGGIFALFRYNTIFPEDDENEIHDEIQLAYKKYYHKPYKKPLTIRGEEFFTPSEIKRGFGFSDMKDYGFSDISMKLIEFSRTFTADEYIFMLETASDHRNLPENNRNALFHDVKTAIMKYGGYYKVDYVYQLYIGGK